jgi:chromosome segregation ATPase
VLGLRIGRLEQQLAQQLKKTEEITADRNGLLSSLKEQKLANQSLDKTLQDEVNKNNQLEKELHYYLAQSGSMIAERDKAILESERAEKEASACRQELSTAQAELKREEEKLSEALKQVDVVDQRCVKLAAQAAESAKVEPLERELEATQKKYEETLSERDQLAKARDEVTRELDTVSSELASTSAESKEEIEGLKGALAKLEEKILQLQDLLEDTVTEKTKKSDELENQLKFKKSIQERLEKSETTLEVLDRLTKLFNEEYRNQRNRIDQKLCGAKNYEEIEGISTQDFGLDLQKIENLVQDVESLDGLGSMVKQWSSLLNDVLCTHAEEKAEQCMYKYNAMQFKQKLAQATAEKVQASLLLAELSCKSN